MKTLSAIILVAAGKVILHREISSTEHGCTYYFYVLKLVNEAKSLNTDWYNTLACTNQEAVQKGLANWREQSIIR